MVGKTVGALAQIKAILLNHIIVLYNICHHVLKIKKKKKSQFGLRMSFMKQ